MITIRPSNQRGATNLDWLDSKHTFSFSNYHDPNFMGFSTLRVINEDKISPSGGFNTHSHRDMEIITYIIEGQLEHKDSIGNGSIIYPGEVQRMTAGTGIAHSEFNASETDLVHLLQIWILPNQNNLTPSYEQKYFAPETKQGKLKLIASQNGQDHSVTIHQDVNLYAANLNENETIEYLIEPRRNLWLQIVKGSLNINSKTLNTGDAAAITSEKNIMIKSQTNQTEFLLFDLI
jgi:redox-sensitive bicupin YhaK (pirin superfamily)